jgi:hypothetical protein
MLRYFALSGLLLLCGCPDSPQANDAGPADGGAEPLAACVERPTELPRPPTDRLPCELIPPSLILGPGK